MTIIECRYKPEKISPTFYLFLFYIAVWWLQLGERLGKRFGTEIRLEAIVAAALLFVTLLDNFRRKPEERAGFGPYVVAYFAVLLLQVAIAWNVERAWTVFLDNVLKYSAMGLLISRFVRTPQQLGWLIFVWLLSCWKGTLEGVIGGISGSLVWENQGIMRLNGNGLWAHPNSFSQFALGVIPFCFYLSPLVKKYWMKAGLLSLFCFATYVVIYTGSRTGYLGYLFMMILFFFQASKNKRKKIFLIFLVISPLIVTFMSASYKDRFLSTFAGKEKEGNSKGARIELYKQGLFIFTKHPFGVGVGNYRIANGKYFGREMDQHCLYTETLTEIGIHGSAIFLLLLYKIISSLRSIIKKTANLDRSFNCKTCEYNYYLINAIARSAYLYLFMRLFMDLFSMDLYGIAWWFIIGICSSLSILVSNLNFKSEMRMNFVS